MNKQAKQHKCSLDGRTFSSKKALADHVRSSHSNTSSSSRQRSNRPSTLPLRQAGSPQSSNDVSITFSRCELMFSADIKKGQSKTSGYKYFDMSSLDKTPVLSKLSRTFECYKIHAITLEFKTYCNVTRDGQFVMGVDYNSSTPVDHTDFAKIMSLPYISGPVYKDSMKISVNVPPTVRFCTISDNARDRPFVVYWGANTNASSDFRIGDVFIHYNITLFGLAP